MRVVSLFSLALVLTACPGRAKTPPPGDSAADHRSSDVLYADHTVWPDGHGHPEASAPDHGGVDVAVPDSAVPDSAVVAFGDVAPGHPQYQQIQWVAQSGIMLGCQTTPPLFCPDDPLTRAQAAVTLVRMKHGDTFTYSSTPHFPNDVGAGHWAFKYIQRLADDGVTSGCASGSFCPSDATTRAQAAVLLIKMKHGDTFTYSQTPHFPTDVGSGYWAFKYIQRLADDKITAGCGAGAYCPEASMLRRHWAVFLFNIKTL